MIFETSIDKLSCFSINEISSPYRKYYAYKSTNDILGYFSIDIIYDKVELINIFVKKEYRNNKIASKMLEFLISYSKKINYENITLEVNEKNIYALKLYEKYGFKRVSIRKKYYGVSDAYLMELVL